MGAGTDTYRALETSAARASRLIFPTRTFNHTDLRTPDTCTLCHQIFRTTKDKPSAPTVRILIVVLVLNLLFWLVVILWRVYILKRARDQIRRQRRHIEGVTNPSLSACEAAPAPRETRERPYVLATPRNELPPSYDEAIKYPSIHLTPTLSFALEQTSRDAATTERTRPPVPPRPSLLRAGGSNDHAENTPANADNGDDTVLPTYEELQSRMATPHAEILLTVHNSHARNFSA